VRRRTAFRRGDSAGCLRPLPDPASRLYGFLPIDGGGWVAQAAFAST